MQVITRRPMFAAPSIELMLIALLVCLSCLPTPRVNWQFSSPATTVSSAQAEALPTVISHPIITEAQAVQSTTVAKPMPRAVHSVRAAAAAINAAAMGTLQSTPVEIAPVILPHASGQCGEDSGVPCTPLTKEERMDLILNN